VRAQRKQAGAENKEQMGEAELARREAEAAEAAADLLREVEMEEQNAVLKKAKGKGKGKKDAGGGSLCVCRCSGAASWALVVSAGGQSAPACTASTPGAWIVRSVGARSTAIGRHANARPLNVP
jgi:hypothetical protein